MKGKIKAIIFVVTLLAMLLIEPLYLKIVMVQQNVDGTQDDTSRVWLFSAGTTVPAGAQTDDIVERAIFYNILDYIGDTPAEVYDFGATDQVNQLLDKRTQPYQKSSKAFHQSTTSVISPTQATTQQTSTQEETDTS